MKHLVMFLLREIIRPVVEEVVAEQMRKEALAAQLREERGPVKQITRHVLSLVQSQKK